MVQVYRFSLVGKSGGTLAVWGHLLQFDQLLASLSGILSSKVVTIMRSGALIAGFNLRDKTALGWGSNNAESTKHCSTLVKHWSLSHITEGFGYWDGWIA